MARWPALFFSPGPALVPTRPSLTLFFWLVGAFLLTLVPHVEQFPLWISVIVVLAMIVRSFLEIYRLPLPSTLFCAVLALCLLAGIFLQFRTIFGRDAGTAFTAGLLAIKFFELRGPRDVALIIFSSFFVVMSALLYSQAVELFVYCLIMMWILTGILLRTEMGDAPDDLLLRMLRQSALIFFQAMPLMVFLFFFFPRFTGKFQIGLDASSIGLTDRVEPGSIARLADDDSTAMTVTFQGDDVPGQATMYWRGLVLWHYAHGAWTTGWPANHRELNPPQPALRSPTIAQTITIWPHYKKWIFALDYPVTLAETASSDWSALFSGNVLQLNDTRPGAQIDHKMRYTVTSAFALAPEEEDLNEEIRREALQLPDAEISPRTRALAEQLRRANPETKSYVIAVLHYFRSEHFVYNDSPGTAGKDPLDEFLFIKKNGFCEHFASAFAVLMRLGGCPARLVVGYHGGQYNPYRNFYTVKQSNAHAWDEVWIDSERRWMRVDPTAAISTRDDQSFASANAEEPKTDESLSIEVAHHRFTFLSSASMPAWLRRTMLDLQLRRQQIEADWDDWVFSYDPETQDRLSQALGFGQGGHSLLLILCLAAAGVCVVVFRKFMRQRRVVAPVENLYQQFCRHMAQRGMPRAVWEGPLAYTHRVAGTFPEKSEIIHDIGRIVARSRYGRLTAEGTDPKKLKSLLLLITASHAASSSREPS